MKGADLQSDTTKLPYILEYSYFLFGPGGLFSSKCLKQLLFCQPLYSLMMKNKRKRERKERKKERKNKSKNIWPPVDLVLIVARSETWLLQVSCLLVKVIVFICWGWLKKPTKVHSGSLVTPRNLPWEGELSVLRWKAPEISLGALWGSLMVYDLFSAASQHSWASNAPSDPSSQRVRWEKGEVGEEGVLHLNECSRGGQLAW